MLRLSAPAGSVNSASSRFDIRPASWRSSRCCGSPMSLRRTGRRSAPAAATAAAAAGALPGLAHVQLPALQLPPVQLGDRLLGLRIGAHLDEAEAPRAARAAVGDDRGGLAGAGLGEQCLEVRARGVEGKVSDEQLLAHVLSPAPYGALLEPSVAWARRRSPLCDGAGSRASKGRGVTSTDAPTRQRLVAEAPLPRAQAAPASAVAAEGRPATEAALRLERLDHRGRRADRRARSPRRWLVVRVVHAEAAPAQLEGVEAADRIGGARRIRELREREPARLTRHAVGAEPHPHARIDVGEHAAQLLLRGLEGKIAYEDRGRNGLLLGNRLRRTVAAWPRWRHPLKQV